MANNSKYLKGDSENHDKKKKDSFVFLNYNISHKWDGCSRENQLYYDNLQEKLNFKLVN